MTFELEKGALRATVQTKGGELISLRTRPVWSISGRGTRPFDGAQPHPVSPSWGR